MYYTIGERNAREPECQETGIPNPHSFIAHVSIQVSAVRLNFKAATNHRAPSDSRFPPNKTRPSTSERQHNSCTPWTRTGSRKRVRPPSEKGKKRNSSRLVISGTRCYPLGRQIRLNAERVISSPILSLRGGRVNGKQQFFPLRYFLHLPRV